MCAAGGGNGLIFDGINRVYKIGFVQSVLFPEGFRSWDLYDR